MKAIVSKLEKLSYPKVAFLQALGLVFYCGLVGVIFWQGDSWFGEMNNYLGPVMVLVLLSMSVIICALISFGYPFLVFWEEKKPKKAISIVYYTAAWLVFFMLLLMLGLFLIKY